MNLTRYPQLAITIVFFAAITHAHSQSANPSIDPTLAQQIASIPAIDNHAHPLLSPPAYATDRNFDALPVDTMDPYTEPAGMRPNLPTLHDAWQAIFHFDGQTPLNATGSGQRQSHSKMSKLPAIQ